jgi:hypothetical protein
VARLTRGYPECQPDDNAALFDYFNHHVQSEPDLPAAPGPEGWSPLG